MLRFTILLLLFSFTTADIKNIQITSNSRTVSLATFVFSDSGNLSFSLNYAAFSPVLNLSRLAFCILSQDAYLQYVQTKQCPLDLNGTQILFDFTRLIAPQNSFHQSYQITTPGEYFIYFASCQPDSTVTMSVTTEMYNLNGGCKTYLPLGQTQLSVIYFVFAAVYSFALLVWAWICGVRDQKMHLTTHLLVGGLFLLKALNLASAGVDSQFVNVTGTSHAWDSVVRSFQWCRVIWLGILMALIGFSWSTSKPLIAQIYMAIGLMNLLLLHGYSVIFETNPFQYTDSFQYAASFLYEYPFVFLVSFIILFLALAFYPKFSETEEYALLRNEVEENVLRKRRNEAKRDEWIFLKFYLLAMISLWWMILMFAIGWQVALSYKDQWVHNVVDEIATLLLYVTMCFTFRRSVQTNTFFVVESYNFWWWL